MGQSLFQGEAAGSKFVFYSCLSVAWAFIFTIIPFTFESPAYAVSLFDHVIAGDFEAGTTCTKPVQKTNFEVTDSKVYSWVQLSDASPVDRLT
jgi:hypothetical protein